MAIENRELEAGTKLVARYKGTLHTLLVLKDEGGKPGFELDNGTIYRSLSKAGSAVMGGTACNGWRFWTPEGELPEKSARVATEAPTGRTGKQVKLIRRVPNQKGVDDGRVKWFCSGCMKSFLTETMDEPDVCPEGHPRLAIDDLAPA